MSYLDISEDEQRAFAARVRAFRLSRYWTMRQMAAATGCGRDTLRKLEHCEDKPKPETVLRVARVMELVAKPKPTMDGLEGIW